MLAFSVWAKLVIVGDIIYAFFTVFTKTMTQTPDEVS
jgi:hypothetical protein